MPRRRSRPGQKKLIAARRQFDRWRKSRPHGERIPAHLWKLAAEAAREEGISRTVQELHLDYYALKRRLAPSVAREPERFLEIPLGFAAAAECVLELADGEGRRLRIELRGEAKSELASLARELWNATPA